jgi:sugar phosphate isomerase/epimerase/nucleoside-diphosphate-sugar epimerase
MIALIGYTGFIGSYLRTQILEPCDLYNSKNISDISNKHYDLIYICGLPATKWKINKYPNEDLDNMLQLQYYLSTCSANTVILISTIDIYSKHYLHQNEDDENITEEPYGKHRFMMENYITETFTNSYIIRLPGIFGFGLKKNIIYDFLNNNNVHTINPFNIYQWYYLEDLMNDIIYIRNNDTIFKSKKKIINLFSEPIKVLEIINMCFPHLSNQYTHSETIIKYDYRSKYPLYKSKDYIINKLTLFIDMYHKINKLVISNLTYNIQDEEHVLSILKRYGISKLELAITKYYNWNNINYTDLKNRFKGFEIYSMQALFFDTNYNLFIQTDEFINHFIKIIDIANILDVKRLVFGSPSNRKVPDNFQDPINYFIKVFKFIADKINSDLIICIEPNATQYGCNFITTISEAIDIINQINHPNIMLNLDTGNAMMMNDLLTTDKIGHIQISAPFLKSICDYNIPKFNYTSWIRSLEMREVPIHLFEKNLVAFIKL